MRMETPSSPIPDPDGPWRMTSVDRFAAAYAMRATDRLPRTDFYIWAEAIERWKTEGMPPEAADHRAEFFRYDPSPWAEHLVDCGWCEPPFVPLFEDRVVETSGDYEIIQDKAGRLKRMYKGRRHGFMPTYLRHVVAGREDWENAARPRLDPKDERRYARLNGLEADEVARQVREGRALVTAAMVGGYMNLRALVGPVEVLYLFHDDPALVHAIMRNWLDLAVAAFTRVQDRLGPIFRLYLGEDICYRSGPLISPAMIREFITPYYRELHQTLANRQRERVYFEIDTDGDYRLTIPPYREAGVTAFSPNEVAAGCDLVEIGRQYPDLVLLGGIDKRILAETPAAIDRMVERILPALVRRGGYVPTCDHGVPDNVPYANYLHYRKRVLELDH
jgi:hypothetical protein